MDLDYSIGAWYVYQWLLATYMYMILKENSYTLVKNGKVSSKLKTFYENIKSFKDECEINFWADFNINFKIMLEWDWKCFEDINLLWTNESKNNDNLIFIQVKTKWWKEPITKTNWIIKSIKNFVENINFQKDKKNKNFLFFIFTNTELSDNLVNEFKQNNIKLYQSIINEIIRDNNKRKTTKKLYYPDKTLVSIKKEEKEFIKNMLVDMVNNNIIILDDYLEYFTKDYLIKLYKLLSDLKIVINNLNIIESIHFSLLQSELTKFYTEDWFKIKAFDNSILSFNKTKIHKWEKKFLEYQKYKYTFFSKEWQIINDLDFISNWKFMS